MTLAARGFNLSYVFLQKGSDMWCFDSIRTQYVEWVLSLHKCVKIKACIIKELMKNEEEFIMQKVFADID